MAISWFQMKLPGRYRDMQQLLSTIACFQEQATSSDNEYRKNTDKLSLAMDQVMLFSTSP